MPNSSTKLTDQEIQFLQSLGLDPNSNDLKNQIQNLIKVSNSGQNASQSVNYKTDFVNKLSQTLTKIYIEIIPELQKQSKTWDIDYDFDRKENKRYENLKKRGCTEILKVGI